MCKCVFQEGREEVRILDDVVGISVENEVIANLSEPIRIDFHHEIIPVSVCACCAFIVSVTVWSLPTLHCPNPSFQIVSLQLFGVTLTLKP